VLRHELRNTDAKDGSRLATRGASSSPSRARNFFQVQTGSGAKPASCPVGAGVKRPGHEADHTTNRCPGREYVDLYIHPSAIRLLAIVLN
jgi:hypothetical protein